MILFNIIEHFITQNKIELSDKIVVIGLSGGPDSVFLLHLLLHLQKKYSLTLIIAHLNHQWRPEADQEQRLCQTIAAEQSLTFVSAKLSELSYMPKYNGSQEEYARKMRRFFLETTAKKYNADYIAVGHHAQDQQETFFIRLIRGASLTGLTAMKILNKKYLRPLLNTNKADILDWLTTHNISYTIDSSNNSPRYLRNKIRATVLPELHRCDNRFNNNFLSTIEWLQQDEDYLSRLTQKTFCSITTIIHDKQLLNIPAFFSTDQALHYRLIIHWLIKENVEFPITQSFFNEILRFLKTPRGGIHALNTQWSLVKKQHSAYIQTKTQAKN